MAKQIPVDQQFVSDTSNVAGEFIFQEDTVVDFSEFSGVSVEGLFEGIPQRVDLLKLEFIDPEAVDSPTNQSESCPVENGPESGGAVQLEDAEVNSTTSSINQPFITFYQKEIDYRVGEALQGRKPPFGNNDVFCVSEQGVAESFLLNRRQLVEKRDELLLQMFYEKLIRLREEDGSTYGTLLTEVKDPLLQAVAAWRNGTQTFETVTSEEFLSGFKVKEMFGPGRGYFLYLRPLVLTELLLEKKFPVSELADASSYYPHLPFAQEISRNMTHREMDLEVAKSVLELDMAQIEQALLKVKKYYQSVRSDGNTHKQYARGPFELYGCSSIGWTEAANKVDEGFINLVTDRDMKRALYEIAADLLNIRTGVVRSGSGDLLKSLRSQASAFSMSPTHYGRFKEAINRYAKNQILWVWNNSEGTTVARSRLCRTIGMKGSRLEGGRLEISTPVTGKVIKSRHPYVPLPNEEERKYPNTTKPLIFVLAIINTWLTKAREVVDSNNSN